MRIDHQGRCCRVQHILRGRIDDCSRRCRQSRSFNPCKVGGVHKVVAMSALWKVEDEVRGRDADTRATLRQQKSAVIVTGLFDLWERELRKISGKSKTADAIRYALSRRDALEQFLADGRVEIDSNIVERAIRPQTITRKNSLFAGSEGGGRTWATLATLLQTCKMNSVDPLAWLCCWFPRGTEPVFPPRSEPPLSMVF